LTLGICRGVPEHHGEICPILVGVQGNGAFTLYSGDPTTYSGYFVRVTQQPTAPAQRCVVTNTTTAINDLLSAGITVSCLAEFAYVSNAADNTLSTYRVDPVTGALTAFGPPVPTGVSPGATAGFQYVFDGHGAPAGYVYVANEGSSDVSVFAVDSTTGALTTVPGSPISVGINPQGMTLYGGTVYIVNAGSDSVSAYYVDTLTVAPGFPVTVGKGPTSIVFSPASVFYVANHGGSNDITALHGDLTPVPGSPFPAGGNPLSLAVGAGGKFLYSANPDATNPSVSGFSTDPITGALAPLSGSPFPLPASHNIATDQAGAFLYVTSGASVLGYAIDGTSGALTALPGFPVGVGANAYSISVDPTNQFLYVANDGAASISGFKLDASTGALTPMAGSPFPAGSQPHFIATF
jgi:6-phosphogluconolactonase (cycloisomerase 2 family)